MPLNYLGPDPVGTTDLAPRHVVTDLLPGLARSSVDTTAWAVLTGATPPIAIPTTATQVVVDKPSRNALSTAQIAVGQAVVINQGTDKGAYVLTTLPPTVDSSWYKVPGPKATTMYVNARDNLYADLPYAQAGDAARVQIANKDAASGVLALGPTGRASPARFTEGTTQSYPQSFWTPTTYNNTVTGIVSDTELYPITVSDPGYPYKVLVYGTVECRCDPVGVVATPGQYVTVMVRQGDPVTGAVVGMGQGGTDAYILPILADSDDFSFPSGLDPSKWAAIAGTGFNPIVVNTGTQSVTPTSNERDLSQWIGPQPAGDRLMITWTNANMSFGSLRIYLCGNAPAWTSWAMLEITRQGPGAGADVAWIYTGTGLPSAAHGTAQKHGDIVGNVNSAGVNILDYDPTNGTGGTFTLHIDGVQILQWNDSGQVVTHGTGHQAVAVMTNSGDNVGAFQGYGIDNFAIADPTANVATTAAHVIPVGFSAAPTTTGSGTTLHVRVNRGAGTTGQTVTNYHPSLCVTTVPA